MTAELSSKILLREKLAGDLKAKCLEYVDKNLYDDFLESESGREMTEKAEEDETGENFLVNEGDWIRRMDDYILFEKTENGQRTLDEIISKAKLNLEEIEILKQWREQAFFSIFEIKEITTNKIRAMDVAAEVDYDIYFNNLAIGHKAINSTLIGSFVQTNILPIKDTWFFSGAQHVLPKESEANIFVDYITQVSDRQIFRNNPEKLRIALENQKEHYKVFIDTFGTDELIVTLDKVQGKLQEYYDKLSLHFGKHGNKIVAPGPSKDFDTAETVGIVMDECEGQHEFEDYGEFVKIFETGNISERSRYLIMNYLKNESMPAFVFRRMKDRYPENFTKIMSKIKLLTSIRIDPVHDFDKLMDLFKHGWQETYPSITPVNQRFAKYYYNNLGHNDPCYCDSGKKYKKCHGK
jgi:hypothetical protein